MYAPTECRDGSLEPKYVAKYVLMTIYVYILIYIYIYDLYVLYLTEYITLSYVRCTYARLHIL
jgi:hypothetical protein